MGSQRVRHNFTTKQQVKELMTTSSISIFLIFRTQRRFSLSEKKMHDLMTPTDLGFESRLDHLIAILG